MQSLDKNLCFFNEVSGQDFPPELTKHIFSFLDPISLVLGASKCNKAFHLIAKDPSLQQNFLPQEVMLHIFSFLVRTKDLVNASKCDQALYQAVETSAIWDNFMSEENLIVNDICGCSSKKALQTFTFQKILEGC